ncbi:primosomal protein N' [Hyphobacterium sp. HN65]|uniref:Replication restart protein PriA n=1 Tax=Hyphobacterium lacteum TaxID=3116575 RepID=A0ABU7LSK3_9PROT|nr:primosomal protein N' [Hyphobacterium sp. HN65]MEE2526902.1 primosomal protein N' [Hyphobacterium sp. HN65]
MTRPPALKAKASILFAMPLPEPFDYAVPEGMELRVGDHVRAPLGPRSARGVVWALSADDGSRNLKSVESVYDCPPLSDAMREFIDWSAKYLVQLPGIMLRNVLRSEDTLLPSPTELLFEASGMEPDRMTDSRRKVLDVVAEHGPDSAAELARLAGVTPGVVTGLVKAGGLNRIERPADPPFDPPDPERPGVELVPQQADAAEQLKRMVSAGGFQAALLDGVTGSGKTEVYFEAIAHALREDPDAQILVLLPEIALTRAVTARFILRFGAEPAVWHSDQGHKERRRIWREVNENRARIVIGARSALFLPFQNLRLIIVDEEHDATYKQGDGLHYQARDLAVVRARASKAAIVLASATPSIETLANARTGRYAHIHLPDRIGKAVLPDVTTIDLREHRPARGLWLSDPLVDAMAETLQRHEQVLLYLNRRGYAPLVLCRDCGHKMKSPEVDAFLTEHRYTGRLICHLTGFSMPRPEKCPECGAIDSLTSVGPGVERVAEEARARFPNARVEILSSDTAHSAEALLSLIDRMERGEIDILVGTQIAAKGHNFPNLTLIGVVDADLGLAGGDPRAGERTYQTLVQVAGRAGRAERPGRALLQTHDPDHDAIAALVAGDRDRFMETETMAREVLGLPPFGRLAAIIISSKDVYQADDEAKKWAKRAPDAEGVTIWGPAEPRYGMVRGWHRRRLLVRGERDVDISAYVTAWKRRMKPPAGVRITIDIEPYSFV